MIRHATILLAALVLFGAMPKPGIWTCVSTESDRAGSVRYSMNVSTYGKWVQFSGTEPAATGPARSFVLLLTYDSKAKRWFIVSYSTTGHFIVSNSAAGPQASRQTWVNLHPVDPKAEPGTIVMSATTWDTYDADTDSGKRVTYRNLCKRSG